VWAVNLVVLQTAAELAYVAGRGELTVGLRIALMVVVALQLLFARGLLRQSAGSVFGLLAFEVTAIVAAVAGDGALIVRAALASVSIAVVVLLLVSIASFPSPDLPKMS
jgi:hypothetical protein